MARVAAQPRRCTSRLEGRVRRRTCGALHSALRDGLWTRAVHRQHGRPHLCRIHRPRRARELRDVPCHFRRHLRRLSSHGESPHLRSDAVHAHGASRHRARRGDVGSDPICHICVGCARNGYCFRTGPISMGAACHSGRLPDRPDIRRAGHGFNRHRNHHRRDEQLLHAVSDADVLP